LKEDKRISKERDEIHEKIEDDLCKVYQKLQIEAIERKKVEEELQKTNRQQKVILNKIFTFTLPLVEEGRIK